MQSGSYGVDAPKVPLYLALGGAVMVALGLGLWAGGSAAGRVWGFLVPGAVLLLSAAVYLHTTLRGKFQVWAELIDQMSWRGDEQVVDLGCGRGAVLVAAARRLPLGTATGVDLWRTVDQSGNTETAATANAVAAGVADRVVLLTADLRELPLQDGFADVVLSSLAIHNLPTEQDRLVAVDEAVRVLRPGGLLLLVDISHTARYAGRLRELGLTPQVRSLGWRYWYGGPWMATRAVQAVRPAAP
jgi:arsenite methyltransferase